MPFVPIIIGIPYTVPCACASRETVCTGRQDPGARSAERAEQSRKAAQWSKDPGVHKRGVGEVPGWHRKAVSYADRTE